MLKKFLILPLVGGLMSITAFASADTVNVLGNQYTSENEITVIDCDSDTSCKVYGDDTPVSSYETPNYICGIVSDIVSGNDDFKLISLSDTVLMPNLSTLYCAVNNDISSDSLGIFAYNSTEGIVYDTTFNGKLFLSQSPISLVSISNGGGDSSTILPGIPSSFTSGLSSLLNNFGSILVGWLPTVILISLGIFAIFVLFRVVRNYARSSFNG